MDNKKTEKDRLLDVGLVTAFNYNIGNNLTNYALYHVISDMGYDVMLIDAPRTFDVNKLFIKPWVKQEFFFQSDDPKEYRKLNDYCVQFLVGSDQLWRVWFVEGYAFYPCLNFVLGTRYKASYGTSTGTDHYEGDAENFEYFKRLLNRFGRISVRESSGAEYLEKELKRNVEVVLDPVFLVEKSRYEEMAEIGTARLPEAKYVAAYILDVTDDNRKILQYVSDKMANGKNNLIIDADRYYGGRTSYGVYGLKEPHIEEWLASIRNSEFFVTDSFHGVCFAIMFNKPFIAVSNKANWRGYKRISDLLSMFQLEERLINDFETEKLERLMLERIDYTKVNEILYKKKAESRKWLIETLEEGKRWSGSTDEYDDNSYIFNGYTLKNVLVETYRMRMKIYAEVIENKKKERHLSNERWENAMTIVGWGAGNCFKRNADIIKENYPLKYVCDTDPEKWGSDIFGVKCISPTELSKMSDVCVIIFVDDPGICFKIGDELQNMGICRYDHVTNLLRALNGEC